MGPEILAALIGGGAVLGAALIGAVPAVLALLRRHRGAVEADGAATRDQLTALGDVLGARIDGVKDELRSDVSELREDVARVREWQAGHDAEHLLLSRQQRGDTT